MFCSDVSNKTWQIFKTCSTCVKSFTTSKLISWLPFNNFFPFRNLASNCSATSLSGSSPFPDLCQSLFLCLLFASSASWLNPAAAVPVFYSVFFRWVVDGRDRGRQPTGDVCRQLTASWTEKGDRLLLDGHFLELDLSRRRRGKLCNTLFRLLSPGSNPINLHRR